jgi:hypothetical protein
METPRIKDNLNELQKQVDVYERNPKVMLEGNIYLYIIGGVLAFLILLRPSFLYRERDGVKKLCLKKILMYWLLLSGVLIIGYYGYTFKNV